jgi:hypothetical protein
LVIGGGPEAGPETNHPSAWWGYLVKLLGPFAGVAVSMFVRVTGGWVATALAYPLTRWSEPAQYGGGRGLASRHRLWSDRLAMTRAYKSLRATWAVRRVAAARLGRFGERYLIAARVIGWAGWALLIAYVVVSVA